MDRNVVPIQLEPLSISDRDTGLSKTSIILSHVTSIPWTQEHATIKVEKQLTITAETESPVIVVTSRYGLMTIDRIQRYKPTSRVLQAHVIYELR